MDVMRCTIMFLALLLTACGISKEPTPATVNDAPELVRRVKIPLLISEETNVPWSCGVNFLGQAENDTLLLETQICGVWILRAGEKDFAPLEIASTPSKILCFAALSDDGRYAAAWENDGPIKLFDLENGTAKNLMGTDYRLVSGCGPRGGFPRIWFSGHRVVVEFAEGNVVALLPDEGRAIERIIPTESSNGISAPLFGDDYSPSSAVQKHVEMPLRAATLRESDLPRRHLLQPLQMDPSPEIDAYESFFSGMLTGGIRSVLVTSPSLRTRYVVAPGGLTWNAKLGSDGTHPPGVREQGIDDAALAHLKFAETINAGTVSEDGRVAYLARTAVQSCRSGPTEDHLAAVIADTETGRVRMWIDNCVAGSTLSPDGSRFACFEYEKGRQKEPQFGLAQGWEDSNENPLRVFIYDTTTGRRIASLAAESFPSRPSIFFSKDSQTIFSAFDATDSNQPEDILEWRISPN